jgi:predicted ribosome quality control (RQC) complex YloA/Tae2 family protein
LTGQLKSRLGEHEVLKGKNVELEKRLARALLV